MQFFSGDFGGEDVMDGECDVRWGAFDYLSFELSRGLRYISRENTRQNW